VVQWGRPREEPLVSLSRARMAGHSNAKTASLYKSRRLNVANVRVKMVSKTLVIF
jgi:hypothetical protein